MDMPANIRCRNCESLRREFAILTAKVATLEAELAKAKKNSANSSKPPSSDIIKPPRAGDRPGSKRKRGAQAGHPRHERPPFAPEEINRPVEYHLSQCPDCGGKVTPQNITPRVVQQVDLADKLTEVSEHRRHACFCRRCQKTYYAEIPAKVRRAGLVGPRLTAVVTYLKGGCHCSFSTIRKFCRDVIGVMVCRGQLRKVCAKVSDSSGPARTLRGLGWRGKIDCGMNDDVGRRWFVVGVSSWRQVSHGYWNAVRHQLYQKFVC